MKKQSNKQTKLRVNARDSMTEIAIIDGHFNHVAKGLGAISAKLNPGIYKVRWKTASTSEDKLIEITGKEEGGVLNLQSEAQQIKSSAPLSNTTLGRVDEPAVLMKLSSQAPAINPEKDSQLLVFLRDEASLSSDFPFTSLSIHSVTGEAITNFSDGIVNTEEKFAGLMVGLDPGVYRLRVETGPLGSYELFISTINNWQTRVFLTCGNFYYKSKKFRRPMLRTTSILMARKGSRFNPDSHNARLAELALNALIRGYDVLDSSDMQSLLSGKFDDPMLGIYSAHLLLQKKRVNWDLFNTVCDNLYHLVGPIPDLIALFAQSKRKLLLNDKDKQIYFGFPPMLILSWDLLIKESKKRFSTIPAGSLSDKIAEHVVSSEPWLMCKVDLTKNIQKPTRKKVSYASAKRLLEQIANHINPSDIEKIKKYLKENTNKLTSIEKTLLLASTKFGEEKETNSMKKYMLSNTRNKTQSNIMPKLQVPSYTLARSAISLAKKLSDKLDLDI